MARKSRPRPPRAKPHRPRSSKTGLAPGSLVLVGETAPNLTRVFLTRFNAETLEEKELPAVFSPGDLPRITPCQGPEPVEGWVTWVEVRGLGTVAEVEMVGRAFGLPDLLLEDVLTTTQRPKAEETEKGALFFVLRRMEASEGGIASQQVAVFFGPGFVVTFQEGETSLYDPIKERLRVGKGRACRLGAGYLAYALLDLLVDGYFGVVESLQERLELLEEETTGKPGPGTLERLHRLKRDMIQMRRGVWPVRDLVAALVRSDSPLLSGETRLHLRDVLDHAVQVMDLAESLRDLTSEMTDIYLTSLNNRLSEVMKFLTAVSTIVIPMTLVAGIYGMNLEGFWPPKEAPWGFAAVLMLMAAAGGGLALLFRTRKWL